jgi:hypothetical protein
MKCSTCPETRARFQKRIEALTDPWHREMLQIWLAHWWGEVRYDIDAVMATITADISYRSYGTSVFGPPVVFNSAEQARVMYIGYFEAGLMPGCPFDNERLAFADWGYCFESVATLAFFGANVLIPEKQLAPEQLYLVQIPLTVVTPFDKVAKKMSGETLYMGAPLAIEPTDRGTIARLLGREHG